MEALVQTNNRGRLSIISCDSGRAFATGLAEALSRIILEADGAAQAVVRDSEEVRFANGETKTVIRESIRGDDVYVVQCIDDPLSSRSVNDNLMALLTAVNAVYQSDPDCITAVIPQFPYARQDRKRAREPITARVVAAALEDVGAGRIITLDIHAPAIEGFFRRAVLENLHASKEIIAFLRRTIPLDLLCVVAPDTGRAQMARLYSRALNCDFAVADKARNYAAPSDHREHAPRGRRRGTAGDHPGRHGGNRPDAAQQLPARARQGRVRRLRDLLASVLQRRRRREARSRLSRRPVQDDRRHRRRVAWQRLRPASIRGTGRCR